MKIFISQPMLGRSDIDIAIERGKLVTKIELNGDTVIDSIIAENAPETSKQGAWYLGKSISLLAEADAAYFVDGWEDARGCCIEHTVAEQYGIPIIHD